MGFDICNCIYNKYNFKNNIKLNKKEMLVIKKNLTNDVEILPTTVLKVILNTFKRTGEGAPVELQI